MIKLFKISLSKKALIIGLTLAVIPLTHLLLRFYFEAIRPPYWFYFDPNYLFYFNSISSALSLPQGFTGHPGTPLIILGGMIIRLVNMFREQSLVVDALSNPEIYIKYIDIIIHSSISILLFVVGILMYRVKKSLLYALIIQLVPLSTFGLFRSIFLLLNSQQFTILSVLIILIGVIYFISGKKEEVRALIFLIIGCGLGTATKITFAPISLFPLLLLTSWKKRGIYVATLIFFVAILTAPISDLYPLYFNWFSLLAKRSDWYAASSNSSFYSGTSGFLPPDYLFNILKLFSANLFYTATFLLGTLILGAYRLKKIWFSNQTVEVTETFKQEIRVLFSLLSVQLLQILFIAKQYAPHQLFAIFILAPINIVLCLSLLNKVHFFRKRYFYLFPSAILVLVIAVFSKQIFDLRNHYIKERKQGLALNEYLQDQSDENTVRIHTIGNPTKAYAYMVGDSNNRFNFRNYLEPMFANDFYADESISGMIKTIGGRRGDFEGVKQVVKDKRILIIGSTDIAKESKYKDSVLPLKQLYTTEDITVYELQK